MSERECPFYLCEMPMPDDLPPAVRHAYAEQGVENFYKQQGHSYRNPHEETVRFACAQAVRRWSLDLSHVLDLACGSGEITLELRELGADAIVGIDPYTGAAYRQRTSQAAEAITFEQIAEGALAGRKFSLIVCSYALHLVEPSRLPGLLSVLGQVAPALLVLSPHKRPRIDPAWGWRLVDEIYPQRVRTRLYRWEQ